jgi:hypothetical protein
MSWRASNSLGTLLGVKISRIAIVCYVKQHRTESEVIENGYTSLVTQRGIHCNSRRRDERGKLEIHRVIGCMGLKYSVV